MMRALGPEPRLCLLPCQTCAAPGPVDLLAADQPRLLHLPSATPRRVTSGPIEPAQPALVLRDGPNQCCRGRCHESREFLYEATLSSMTPHGEQIVRTPSDTVSHAYLTGPNPAVLPTSGNMLARPTCAGGSPNAQSAGVAEHRAACSRASAKRLIQEVATLADLQVRSSDLGV
eukprot:193500-Amphidinium_carterae.2